MTLHVIIAILFYTAQASAQATVACSGQCACGTHGTTSGSFDTSYQNNWGCYWTITSSCTISLQFSRFSLEQGYDFVTVTSNTQLCYSSASNGCPNLYTSTTGTLSVSLTADYSVLGSGIAASWSVSACPVSCNPGFASTNSGPCTACVAGKYKIASGSAACTDCTFAKFTTTTGATLESACNTCNVGFTGPDGGVCSACASGKYKSIIGSAVCTDCPVNTYQRPDLLAGLLISSPAYLAASAEGWDSANNRFTDLSGNAGVGALSAGTVIVGSVTGNGATRSMPYVGGTTGTKMCDLLPFKSFYGPSY